MKLLISIFSLALSPHFCVEASNKEYNEQGKATTINPIQNLEENNKKHFCTM